MKRFAWIVGIWLVAMSHARGQPLPLELAWQAPSECPSSIQARAELERVARVRPGYNLTQLSARVEIEHRADAYVMRLRTEHDGQAGERRLEAADCKTLIRTLTLVLALAFGTGVEVATETGSDTPANDARQDAATEVPAESTTATEDQAKQGEQKAPAPPVHEDAAAMDSTTAARADEPGSNDRTRSLRVALLAGGGAQLGLLPSAAFSATAGVELGTFAWSLGLRASAWPGVSRSVASDARAEFDGFAGALQGCGRLPLAAIVLALCADARAAALHGQASGALQHGTATAPWYALAGSAALTWPRRSWLALRLEAALAASLDRPRFVIVGLREVHRVAQLVPDLGLHLLVTL